MNHYFDGLSLHDQLQLVAMGKCVERISFPHYDVALYAVAEFFLEVFYCREDYTVQLIAVADEVALEKYLAQITLPSYLMADRN